MAAAITTTATTLEAQVMEVCNALVAGELAIEEESRPDNVSITPDIDGEVINVTIAMPAAFSAGAAGKIELDAVAYLA